MLEPYLCRSFAGIEYPISGNSTTVKPLMLAKFKVKRKKKRKKEKERKRNKSNTPSASLLA